MLADIVVRGYPAFLQNRLLLSVSVDRSEIDPQGTRDPAVIRNGDFQALVRNALRAQFPDVTDRAGRRLLDRLLSSGASDALRQRVIADPALVGQTVTAPVLLSADADLFFKGGATRSERRPGQGVLSISGSPDDLRLLSSANDFAGDVTTIKRELAGEARNLRRQASELQQAIRRVEARKSELERGLALAPASTPLQSEIATLTAEIELLSQKVKELEDHAAALQARFDGAGIEETLDDKLPSLLVAVNGGLVKITKVGNAQATATVLLPMQSTCRCRPRHVANR